MKIRIIGVGIMLFIFGCATTEPMKDEGGKAGKPLVILKSFASKAMRPGDQLRVYLQASDEDGDMKTILTTLVQPGRGMYPISRTAIPKGQEKELSGYRYLNTFGTDFLNYKTIQITVQVQDRIGQFSQPASFAVSLNRALRMESPPAGIFDDREIGPIMVNWETNQQGGAR